MSEELLADETCEAEFVDGYPNLAGVPLEEQRRATIGFALIAAQIPVKPLADFAAMVVGLAELFRDGQPAEPEPPRLTRVK